MSDSESPHNPAPEPPADPAQAPAAPGAGEPAPTGAYSTPPSGIHTGAGNGGEPPAPQPIQPQAPVPAPPVAEQPVYEQAPAPAQPTPSAPPAYEQAPPPAQPLPPAPPAQPIYEQAPAPNQPAYEQAPPPAQPIHAAPPAPPAYEQAPPPAPPPTPPSEPVYQQAPAPGEPVYQQAPPPAPPIPAPPAAQGYGQVPPPDQPLPAAPSGLQTYEEAPPPVQPMPAEPPALQTYEQAPPPPQQVPPAPPSEPVYEQAPAPGQPVPTAAPGQDEFAASPGAGDPSAVEADASPPNGASSPSAPRASSPASIQRRISGGKLAWAAVALALVAVGVIASFLGAHKVASNDAASARQSSQQSAAAAAAAAKLSLQRQEEIPISGSTFLAGNPTATPAEFDRWAKWAQTLRRYPALGQLGLVALVRAPELPSFEASAPSRLAITPSGARAYYCLARASLARHPHESPPAGFDYCAERSGLERSRDTGVSHYALVGNGLVEMMTPVYRGNQPPATVLSRQGAFVGWLREVFSPAVVIGEALQGHPGVALNLGFHGGSTSAVFDGHAPGTGTATTKVALHDGWTVQSYAAPVNKGVVSDGNALALLIVGCALSALLGLLVLVLASGGRRRGRAPAPAYVPEEREAPAEELYDRLTGLPNRALMLDRAECLLARAGRQSGLLVGALFIDLDWFEDLNERLGPAAGDRVLKIVSERLEGVVRAGDTVGRLGGDEFVLLVESAARGARLDSLARRVVEALHKPFDLEGHAPDIFLTASIGVAFGRYSSAEDLLRDAQLALHAAKSAGKDRYTLFNANMRSVIEGRGVLEVELNAALADKQFFLLYEPIFDLATGQVAGLEALVRWLHPKQGVLLPADFIPLAEETGLTVPIGRWVLEEACSRAAAWNVAGHHIGLTVEVSSNQLNRDGFATDVRRALQQSGIEPALLTLAIPETVVMRDVSAAVDRLQEIKQLGVRIAIDDFGGSGYAYHSDLRRLPLDFLKVDRSSLAASEDEEYRTWLLEAIMIVGRDLSLLVVAKGIETSEQMSALQAMGCTMAQGVLMGKPVPASAIENVFTATVPSAR